jgi:hypothetical protein
MLLTRRTLVGPLLALSLAAGCNPATDPLPGLNRGTGSAGHPGHKGPDWGRPGAHGGLIARLGSGEYHAEICFERDGTLRLHMLGKDWRKVADVEEQPLVAHVRPLDGAESLSVVLNPARQPGDAPGRTSQFVGVLPEELRGQRLEVTIPSLAAGGERYRVAFRSEPHQEGMPPKITDDAERTLYLTPGGKYTEADIRANGSQTASQKFERFRASHDFDPKPGDVLCPVTLTKANPACTWVIGGKTYQFCCPPCIDEFLTLAKEKPDEVKDPEAYVKK